MGLEICSPSILRFATFEADLRAGELRKQGKRLKLQDQPFQVLSALLLRPGDVVTREELRKQIWPEDTFVDFDNSLNTAINKLREALGDSADNPRFIETLPRRGYRFLVPVSDQSHQKQSPTLRKTWKIAAGAGASVAILAIAAGLSWRSRHAGRLTDQDTIVLADFTNTTGDAVFDDTLKQGLRVQLEESPFLNILSDQKVSERLRLMGRPGDERLTLAIGREVCQRVGSKVVLAGTISSLGSHYVIGLNAFNCLSGDVLASEQVEVDSREHVLKALGESATKMREKLGESLASIQKYFVPYFPATTASLEAFKAYSVGSETFRAKGNTAALPFFQRAVELDPRFALAYGRMAALYGNLGEYEHARESARKAYELRETVSDRERLYIEAHYYDYVTGEVEKAIRVYQVWEQTYPRDDAPHNNLASEYAVIGKYEQGLEEARTAQPLQPLAEENNVTLALAYIYLNRIDEAEAVLKQAEENKLAGEDLLGTRFLVAFLKGNGAEMDQLSRASTAGIGGSGSVLWEQELAEVYHGRLRKARRILRLALNTSRDSGSLTAAANDLASLGLMEAYFGESQNAIADANEALNLTPNEQSTLQVAALALAVAGDAKAAEGAADKLNRKCPFDTVVQRYLLPMSGSAIALANKKPDKAIELLSGMTPYELSGGGLGWQSGLNLDQIYIHGLAFLMQRNSSAAIAEFQKVIDHPGIVQEDAIGALAHLQLGRAYVQQGDLAKARAAYQDFLTLWKDADPDIPILQQAKAEFVKLQ